MHLLLNQILLLLQEVEPAAEGGEEGSAGLLLPAPEELIAGIVAFSIVFFIVWRWAIPALNTALDRRAAAIQSQYDAAEAAKQEAESLLADYEKQMADAKSEAARLADEARQAADEVKSGIVERAEAEAEQMKARAQDEIAAERERAASELRRQVADLSLDVAERVTGLTLDEDSQRELVDRYIDELGGVS